MSLWKDEIEISVQAVLLVKYAALLHILKLNFEGKTICYDSA